MSQPTSITGIDDPTKARVVLWMSGRLVHAPLDAVLAASTGVDGAFTVTGAFTSPGIDDNATGERLEKIGRAHV